ncbi:PEPxxWA-CTERM sorting domain-containing protein [Sandaracinobacter sp. RS1-74]|uniref:lectin-like domain-containing protein n=1 Tax=Sandaracinobacteroides sayramensis TaxID=2913411 RepID=UPI001EDA4054|nr:PEPxxWA-CTERM sorting domain-containing protein [Sandaracinobacteroides sayramensis]MCG2840018.1 PEPxxWA-CTERM sorting domain-containing protein [Sandaracinobacteroides sayramensis]
MRVAIIALAAISATPASALSLVYNDFSNTSGLSLNGQSSTAVDAAGRDVLRVTRSAYNQSGSVFSTTPVTLGADVSFSTRFTFNFNTPLGGGADGLVFVVQTNSNDVGGYGGGIGYQGVPNSVGIEFDTWDNGQGWGDPDANHVGIDLNGNISSVKVITSPFTLDEGGDLTAWVDYNGATKLLEVRLANSLTRPAEALLSYSVDLVSVLGTPDAFVGFTSGTGSAAANHDVISWIFNDDYKPIVGGVPEPATWAMLIAGFGLVGAAARRRRALSA